jgi:hypothetical protein
MKNWDGRVMAKFEKADGVESNEPKTGNALPRNA